MRTKPLILIAVLCGTFVQAQPPPAAPANPFAPQGPLPALDSRDMLIRYETFSIDPSRAAAMRREKPADEKFYETLVAGIAKGESSQETLTVVRARSGQKAKTESIREYIYPTEFEPARVTTPALLKGGVSPRAATPEVVVPAAATAFETRNTGFTLEVEATMAEEAKTVDLRIVPDHVGLAERLKWGNGTSETEMPFFETQRVNTMVKLSMGKPFLIGTVNPPDVSKLNKDRIWFAFVTINLSKK